MTRERRNRPHNRPGVCDCPWLTHPEPGRLYALTRTPSGTLICSNCKRRNKLQFIHPIERAVAEEQHAQITHCSCPHIFRNHAARDGLPAISSYSFPTVSYTEDGTVICDECGQPRRKKVTEAEFKDLYGDAESGVVLPEIDSSPGD